MLGNMSCYVSNYSRDLEVGVSDSLAGCMDFLEFVIRMNGLIRKIFDRCRWKYRNRTRLGGLVIG